MKRLSTFAAGICAVAVTASAVPALAQYATEFVPAKVAHQGSTTKAVAGPGSVTVQVEVNANGTHKAIRVLHSTNHGDDAAAMEIAQNSTYIPAHKGKTKETAFYDFTLRFNGKSAAAQNENQSSTASNPVEGLIRAGKYPAAISRANADLASNPNDTHMLQLLGVAQFYNNDFTGAVQSFGKAGSVDKQFAPLASQAYAKVAVSTVQSDPAQSLADAQKAYALDPGPNSRFALGAAQLANKDYADAVTALQAARDAVPASNAKARLNIDSELLQAQLGAGNTAAANQVAADMKSLDPNGAQQASYTIGEHWLQVGIDALNAKKAQDALNAFDQAIATGNSQVAVTANTYAAFAVLRMENPDYGKARDYAVKALSAKPDDAEANYAAGVAYAGLYAADQKSDDKASALDYLNKADQYAKAAGDTKLAATVEAQIKNLSQHLQQ